MKSLAELAELRKKSLDAINMRTDTHIRELSSAWLPAVSPQAQDR